MKNLIRRYLYKEYQKGRYKVVITLHPDNLSDCISIGHIRSIKFKSGNIYKCKFCYSKLDAYGGLYTGIYEITNDIQKLSFEQFSQFNIFDIKRNKNRKIKRVTR